MTQNKLTNIPKGEQVTRRHYKQTEMTLPLLGFGTMRLPKNSQDDKDIDYPTTERMFARAMEAGCNYFDTAYPYHGGRSEICVGDLLVSNYPRDSFYLTSKMLLRAIETEADVERIFQEQLTKTRAGYFDFYLMHAVNRKNWLVAEKVHLYDFLAKKKEEGLIRYIGFSFHDTPEVLQTIASAYPWDVTQIQLNYLDWETYRSREQYEVLTKLGIPVLVMEPLRGGALATLSPQAVECLKQSNPNATPASWGLRWVASLPNVLCTLSGMSHPDQLEDNIATFTPMKPLTDPERETLAAALEVYRNSLDVPCTGCNYCQPCPVKVEIPRIFAYWNQYKITHSAMLLKGRLSTIPEGSTADHCISCKSCLSKCPQHIDIPANLARIAEALKSL